MAMNLEIEMETEVGTKRETKRIKAEKINFGQRYILGLGATIPGGLANTSCHVTATIKQLTFHVKRLVCFTSYPTFYER